MNDPGSFCGSVTVFSYTYVISCFTPGLKLPFVVSPFSLTVGSFTGFSTLTNSNPSFSTFDVVYESSFLPSCNFPSSAFLPVSTPSWSFVM